MKPSVTRTGDARCVISLFIFIIFSAQACSLVAFQTDQIEFFESKIRPILIEHCYACHNSIDQKEADYAIDFRKGAQTETEHGIGVVPGEPDKSLLLKVIRHQIDGLEMPEGSPKLSPEIIADFEKWISDGAADPRNTPPTAKEFEAATSWENTLKKRKQWWSFQPIVSSELPAENPWSNHPIDRFTFDKFTQASVKYQPSTQATPSVLLRRLTYALTGLPPTLEQLAAINSNSKTFEQFVDELLASPQFGERWARHWMDLVRYADSHGSEGDPAIPNAYQYRDYLIRAFNADVPFDQLVREHIAGDLLTSPRINKDLGINESAIGPAHWRLCFHGFAPTDALDEKVRFTDDQINVFSKSFLGLTVSCARCHDHKFDAISQADYYALFGIIGSCRPAMRDVNTIEKQRMHQERLTHLKSEIKKEIVLAWEAVSTNAFKDKLLRLTQTKSAENPNHVLHLASLLANSPQEFNKVWRQHSQQALALPSEATTIEKWDLANQKEFQKWYFDSATELQPSPAGQFTIAPKGEQVISSIRPSGIYSNLLSNRHRAVLGSPKFPAGKNMIAWARIMGEGQATARYVVQDYPRSGTVYPIHDIKNRNWYWQKFDLTYWEGDDIHLEFATAKDAPLQVKNQEQSWFGIREVVFRNRDAGPPPQDKMQFLAPIFVGTDSPTPTSLEDLIEHYRKTITTAIVAWEQNTLTDEQAMFLDALIRDGVVQNDFSQSKSLQSLTTQYRNLELEIPTPFRVPGVSEAEPNDQALFARGDHRKPLDPVKRRFLEAIDAEPYQTLQSGRLELANDLFRVDNPLTARVIVNRIWLKLYGRGIVNTPDNFGYLGEQPTHPALLDYLATRMATEKWSIKKMIRLMVTSKTWQQSSQSASSKSDPENKMFARFGLQRLDAESIRDAMVAVSGRLDDRMYGAAFNSNSNSVRRAVYIRSKRNNMDKFLAVFDSPIPFATTGRRSATNVPAQSLTLLNSPFVFEMARQWANQIKSPQTTTNLNNQISGMHEAALGRKPSKTELETLVSYYQAIKRDNEDRQREYRKVSSALESARIRLAEISDPTRQKLMEQNAKKSQGFNSTSAAPIAHWKFSEGNKDLVNGRSLQLKAGAKIIDNALILDGSGFALSTPIAKPLHAHSLEAWVQLDSLNQKGGGVVGVQSLDGNIFDSIVFAEIQPKHWLAGSEFHNRTSNFGGKPEKTASETPVHLAITYDTDGTIRGYRNGKPYGKPIQKSKTKKFNSKQWQVALGIRHGIQTSADRVLSGKILEARVYDLSLSAVEIASSFAGHPIVSEKDVWASLSPEQRKQAAKLKTSISSLETTLSQSEKNVAPDDAMTRVAHAIFNLKEFIYLR